MMETHNFIKHFPSHSTPTGRKTKNVILPGLDWNYNTKEELELLMLLSPTPEFKHC